MSGTGQQMSVKTQGNGWVSHWQEDPRIWGASFCAPNVIDPAKTAFLLFEMCAMHFDRCLLRVAVPWNRIWMRLPMTTEKTQISARPSAYRWVVFSILAAGYLLVNFHRLCPAIVALDMMEDLKAGGWLMGLLASAYFYPYALMQLPSGLLSDTWGPRKTVTGFLALAGVGSILFGLAQSPTWAIVARILVGLGVAMLFVPTMKILTRWFRSSEFSLMTSILMATGGVGLLSAATPLAYISDVLGWRGSFVVIGVVTLFLAAAIGFLVRDRPEEMGLPAVEVNNKPNAAGTPPQRATLWQGVGMVLGSARFWPLSGWFFFNFAIFFSFGGLWGGPYLIHVYGLSKQQAGGILSMLAVGTIVGSPLLSIVSDRLLHSRKQVIVASSVIASLLTVPLAFFPASFNIPLLYVWSLLYGLTASAVVVVAFATAKESFPVEMAGTAVGLVNLCPFLGAAIMQPVLGMILDAHGQGLSGYPPEAYGKAFLLYFVSSIIAFAAACGIQETLPPRGKAAARS